MKTSDRSKHTGLSNLSRKSIDVAKYYDDWASDYDKSLADWRYDAPDKIASIVRANLTQESRILDAGCGTGLCGKALNVPLK
jgi:predicted TPR repeat methyltransferase